MFCNKCGKELPDESELCPYCMTKFVIEKEERPLQKKAVNKKLFVIIAAVCVVIAVASAIAVPLLKKDKNTYDPAGYNSSEKSDSDEKTVGKSQKAKSVKDDDNVGLMGIKINDKDINLSDTEKLIVQYFDTDYFRAPYSMLQRYPKAYKNAQIDFLCYVTKIIESDDTTFTALVEYEAYKIYDSEYKENTGVFAVITGQQSETRIMEGDSLYLYGKFMGVDSYTVDGTSYNVPTVLINRYTYFYYFDMTSPMYTYKDIRAIAEYIFGEDVRVREFTEEDNENEIDFYSGEFYIAELDNQSNANFTKYEFFAGWGGYIEDMKSEYPVERRITFSANFENFYVSVFDRELKIYTLECYDRNLNKLWKREFEQTTSANMDYTRDHIYLVANGSLYIINTSDGKDAVEPKYVGIKAGIRKLSDGLLLLSYTASDAVMKTDLLGNVLWTANFQCNQQIPDYGSEAPVVQLINDRYVIQYSKDPLQGVETRIAVITTDGTVETDQKSF